MGFSVSIGPTEAFLLLFSLVIAFTVSLKCERERKYLPPGPRGIPFLGNVLDIPQDQPWAAFSRLSKQYGDVISFSIMGQTTIVLNSASAVTDLLDKRSSIYSTRPGATVSISQMTGWIWSMIVMPYGDDWRRNRRMLWQFLQPNAVGQWHSSHTRGARRLLRALLDDSSDLDRTTRLSFCKTLTNVTYGIPAEEDDWRFVDMIDEADAGISEAYDHAALMIPWVRRIPSWCPGGRWQRKLAGWQKLAKRTREEPFERAQGAMSRGDASPSITSKLLDGGEKPVFDPGLIKAIAAVIFLAGTDTTVGTFLAFVCAMIIHPEAQKRAQEELDAVVGPGRLPELADRPSLPYVHAVVKELLRWHNVAPLGVPHSCTREDDYRGWKMPTSAIILINIWGILHDPELYPNPDAFIPQRFLKDGKLNQDVFDPASIAFGAGRRICPGRHFADDSLFINIASMLHVFNITPAADEQGFSMPVKHEVTTGLLSVVEPFEYRIRIRSTSAESLVRELNVD
ncbi:cytochrome P450 [Cubamyces sp. BRFM 1775]|nr:cytochrome P450 [Cubamyces sp. BRFM 1775]